MEIENKKEIERDKKNCNNNFYKNVLHKAKNLESERDQVTSYKKSTWNKEV